MVAQRGLIPKAFFLFNSNSRDSFARRSCLLFKDPAILVYFQFPTEPSFDLYVLKATTFLFVFLVVEGDGKRSKEYQHISYLTIKLYFRLSFFPRLLWFRHGLPRARASGDSGRRTRCLGRRTRCLGRRTVGLRRRARCLLGRRARRGTNNFHKYPSVSARSS
jgi:hypothetical protein